MSARKTHYGRVYAQVGNFYSKPGRCVNFYKRHLGDIAKSCSDLSQGQMGAYDLLLDWMYSNEKPLPLAADKLYRIGRATTKAERDNVDSVLGELFVRTEGGYTHKRASEEMAKADAQAETNRRIAIEREARNRATREARTEHEACTNRQPIQTPDSISHKEQEPKKGAKAPALPRPESVSESTWADWLALRKAKKAPVTGTVVKQAVTEAAKAGMSLEDFLQVWCARGSQGLEADWLKPNERARAGPAAPAQMGKTMTGIMALEAMKNGLANSGSGDGNPAALVSEPRRLPGR